MARKIPKNLSFLCESFNRPEIKGVILQGSSGSRKTYSIIDFLVIASTYRGYRINIIKETYNSYKTTLYYDFGKRLDELQIRNPFSTVKDISSFKLFDSSINFLGADNPNSFTGRCDILWGNEILDIPKDVWQQARQRCERFWIGDMNPKTTQHYVYDFEKRKDVLFLTTTFQDNPFIPENSRLELLAYDPNNPANVEAGTADEYMWDVYGLGKRAAREGLVHPHVDWINEFPADCEKIGYGIDFGYTNSPTAIMKVGNKWIDRVEHIYAQKLFYAPTPDISILIQAIDATIPKDQHFTCDSAESGERGWISDLRLAGYQAIPCKKFPGSIKYSIDLVNRRPLHIVKDADMRKEQENRVWKYVGGIPLNEPEAGNDHGFDGIAYCLQTDFRY